MPLIPEKLRQSHEDGQVVFFCGAGVSVPTGLPSFKGLVEQVIEELAPSQRNNPVVWQAYKEQKYDEALDILERHTRGGFGKEVRSKVSEILENKLRPKRLNVSPHTTLCKLASLDRPDGRLITTNFDPLFEIAQNRLRRRSKTKDKLSVEIAPALSPPKPKKWANLVYLHGKLGKPIENENLVLTTSDFGRAYLLDGWARRIVIELFRNFEVVFVGYRIEDPTMRYLVSALAAARGSNEHFKDAYAFAPYDGDQNDDQEAQQRIEDAWKLKGVIPLAYNSLDEHKLLWEALKEWAEDFTGGLGSKLQKVTRYGQFRPTDTPNDVTAELVWALKDKNVAEFVSKNENVGLLSPAWIPHFEESGILSLPIGNSANENSPSVPLVSYVMPLYGHLNEVTQKLGTWIAKHLESEEVINWVIRQGGVLHPDLRRQIQINLENTEDISGAFRKIWAVLSSEHYAHALSERNTNLHFTHPSLSPDRKGDIRNFLYRLKPIPIFTKKLSYQNNKNQLAEKPTDICGIELDLVGIDGNYHIESFQNNSTDWDGTLALIANDITTYLNEAMDWMQEFNLASGSFDQTYIDYRSIKPHSQNEYAPDWTWLIRLARESQIALANQDHDEARRLIQRWRSIDYPVFRRLALDALTRF